MSNSSHHLIIDGFRNLHNIDLTLTAKINFFIGSNGSGKTSLLESLYFLSRGKSFRTPSNKKLLQWEKDQFSIFFESTANGVSHFNIGNLFSKNKLIKQLDGQRNITQADIIQLFSVQLITPRSYEFIVRGPSQRRKILDWGVFHVEPSYLTEYKKYMHILKQRNSVLRQRINLGYWDDVLCTSALIIQRYRSEYIVKLNNVVIKLCAQFLADSFLDVSISYTTQYSNKSEMLEILNSRLEQDIKLGYTGIGPHRDDLKLSVNNHHPKDGLSNGEQKLFMFIVFVAQAIVSSQLRSHPVVLLIDDFGAELDDHNKQLLVDIVSAFPGTLFITSPGEFGQLNITETHEMFHVEHGHVKRKN